MVWTVRELTTTLPPCPCCTSPLLELSDMWGVFYACEDCGYEVETLETDLSMKRTRPPREAVSVGGYRLDHGGELEGRGTCQASDEAPGSHWA